MSLDRACAMPAGLVIAVTAYITTDVAAAPFLWVLPLALYLLTFVAVFRDTAVDPARLRAAAACRIVVAPLAISMLGGDKVYWLAIIALNLVGVRADRAGLSRRGLRAAARAGAADRVLSVDLVRRRDRRHLRRAARAARVQQHLRVSDPDRRGAAGACPACSRGGCARMLCASWRRAARSPPLAWSQLAIMLDVRLPVDAELPFQVAAGRSRGRDAVPGAAARRASSALVVAGLRRHRPLAARRRRRSRRRAASSACIRWSRPPTARTACCFTAPPSTARSACATRTARPSTGRPEPLTYYYFGGPISEAITRTRAPRGSARPRRGGRARHRQPRLPSARRRELDLLRDRSRR